MKYIALLRGINISGKNKKSNRILKISITFYLLPRSENYLCYEHLAK